MKQKVSKQKDERKKSGCFKFALTILILVVTYIGYIFYSLSAPHLSTSEMETYFYERKEQFVTINKQILASISLGQKIDASEWKKFETSLIIRGAIQESNPDEIKYFTHMSGFGTGTFGTGIAYRTKPPEKLFPSLKDAKKQKDLYLPGYCHLEGRWYSFFWED